MKLDILDYSVYGNWVDDESDARMAEAARELGIEARIVPIEREKPLPECTRWVWLRYDLRSREDLRWTAAVAGELARRGHVVYPSEAALVCAEDKWETFLALHKAGVPVLAHHPVEHLAACGKQALLKTRVGWGGVGMLRVGDTESFARPAGIAAEDYVCQAFVPHERTWTVAATSEASFMTLEKWRREDDFRTDGDFCREVRVVPERADAAQNARAALRAVGLIAGTVDQLEVDGEVRVLEVNSAPCLVYSEIERLALARPMVTRVCAWMQSCVS